VLRQIWRSNDAFGAAAVIFVGPFEVTPMLDPRGLDHATAMLRSTDIPHAISGSAAVRAYLPAGMVPVAPLTTLILHTRQPADQSVGPGRQRMDIVTRSTVPPERS